LVIYFHSSVEEFFFVTNQINKQMNFQLNLHLPDAEQEAVWLNDSIKEEDFNGLQTNVVETTPESDTMDGGIFTGVLALIVTESITQTIEKLFDFVFKHFDGKRAAFELEGECPNNGKKFALKFETTTKKGREKAIEEFNQLFETFCK
jgi:hypothetical protein